MNLSLNLFLGQQKLFKGIRNTLYEYIIVLNQVLLNHTLKIIN